MKKIILFLTIVFYLPSVCLFSFHNEKKEDTSGIVVDLEYRALQPGEVIKVVMKGSSTVKLAQIQFSGNKYTMGRTKNRTELLAFVGLDLALKQGKYPMIISLLHDDGRLERIQKDVVVSAKEFLVTKLWVKEEFITPPPEVQERIKWESELLQTVYGIFTPQWLGDEKFIIPSIGKAALNFGERRVYNNKLRSSHSGVDISSPYGDPVKASNTGKVALADDLYFSGKTVIIDHGLGVFTIYLHFSKINVKTGDFVRKGDVIGNIGATGRVTGPHLHWGARILGNRIDPFSFLSLDLE